MAETIITGKKYRILTDVTNKIWSRISFWTKASDVECNDGTTVETKVGNIKGLVDTFSVTEDGYVIEAKKVAEINSKLGGCSFEQEGTDFYVTGADSVRKKLGSGIVDIMSNGYLAISLGSIGAKDTATTIDVKNILPNTYNLLDSSDFKVSATGANSSGSYAGGNTSSFNFSSNVGVSPSYVASTGILTIPRTQSAQVGAGGGMMYGIKTWMSVQVWLITRKKII